MNLHPQSAPRRSLRIRTITENKILQINNTILEIFKHSETFELLIINTIHVYKILFSSFNLVQQYESDIMFSRYLYRVFTQSATITGNLYNENNNTTCIYHKIISQLLQIFKKMNKQIMDYYRGKLNALTKNVWLNDDVVYLIYSYI